MYINTHHSYINCRLLFNLIFLILIIFQCINVSSKFTSAKLGTKKISGFNFNKEQSYNLKENLSVFSSPSTQIENLTEFKSLQSNVDTCIIQNGNNQFSINLGNCQNQLYYVTLGIGTPPQYFNLQLDTGSNVLWVPTVNANILGFNQTNSSTFTNLSQPYQIQYVNGGFVKGTYGNDYVTLLNTSINVTMSVVFADNVSGLSLPNGVIGIVGFGYTSVETDPNFLDLAYSNGQINTNNFSLSLQNIYFNSSTNSTLFYNYLPNQLTKNSIFSSVADTFYWEVNLIGVTAGNEVLTPYAAQVAVIDSGTSLFYLNPPLTQQFISSFLPNNLCNFTDGLNICNVQIMTTLPNLTFIFSNVAVILTPQDYTQCFGTTCYVHIYTIQTDPPEVLLGDTLFMKYNITFSKSQKQIGFQGNIKYVGVFGNNLDFIISQYVMAGISFALFLFLLITMIVIIVKEKNQRNLLQQIPKQRVTQLNVMQIK